MDTHSSLGWDCSEQRRVENNQLADAYVTAIVIMHTHYATGYLNTSACSRFSGTLEE